jgi:hypothetical protein
MVPVDQEKVIMSYTLLTKNGKIMQFYVLAIAELYLTIKGGTLFCNEILERSESLETV